jgi:LPS sulfotransferase NodH
MQSSQSAIIAPRNSRKARQEPGKPWLNCRRLIHRLHLLRHWWFSPHTPYQAVFLIAGARSGSTLLGDYMSQLPGVQSLSEILNWMVPIGPRKKRLPSKDALEHIRLSMQTRRAAHRSCKLTVLQLANYQLTLCDLDAVFPGAKFIVLYRKLLVEQFVSLCQARMTKQWTLLPGQERKRASVTVDPDELRRYCEQTRRGYEEVLTYPALAERGAILSYEELTADPVQCLRERICPLLGVPAIEPKTIRRKQNPQPLAERVVNFSEIAALAASPLCRQEYALPARREAA